MILQFGRHVPWPSSDDSWRRSSYKQYNCCRCSRANALGQHYDCCIVFLQSGSAFFLRSIGRAIETPLLSSILDSQQANKQTTTSLSQHQPTSEIESNKQKPTALLNQCTREHTQRGGREGEGASVSRREKAPLDELSVDGASQAVRTNKERCIDRWEVFACLSNVMMRSPNLMLAASPMLNTIFMAIENVCKLTRLKISQTLTLCPARAVRSAKSFPANDGMSKDCLTVIMLPLSGGYFL